MILNDKKEPLDSLYNFDALLCQAVGDKDLSLNEIPDIDLYIDQILTLVANKTESASDFYKDNILTKTMINNYSKNGVLSPIKGKKYTKNHIIQMLLIYSLKNNLSISEIGKLMSLVFINDNSEENIKKDYEKYLLIKDKCRHKSKEIASELIESENLDLSLDDDFFEAVAGLISYSTYLKSIAQVMICKRFPEKDEEIKAVKDKEKKKKLEVSGKDNDKYAK